MILQGNLLLKFDDKPYLLMVKVHLKNGVYYFFVSEREKKKSLLSGETVELTYKENFCPIGDEGKDDYKNISPDIISAIKKMLLNNKQLWIY